jgi:hypothetical protein
MCKLHRLVIIATLLQLIIVMPLSAQDGGFVSMFDGKTMQGWKMVPGHKGHWRAVNGVIDYDGLSEAKTRDDMSLFSEQ